MSQNVERRPPKKVLVFPCGSEIGLEIHRALRFTPHVTLLGASSVTSNHGKYVYRDYVEGIPFVDAPDFIPAIAALVKEQSVDFIYPAHDSVVLKLAQHSDEMACTMIGSPLETCTVCRSKKATYARLEGVVPIPRRYTGPEENIEYPVFLKPDVSQGSKGIALAQDRKALEAELEKNPDLLILEYLPGDEYTVDCFTDRHGVLHFVGARQRDRVTNGISVESHPVGGEEFDSIAKKINETLVFRGAWFFQVRRASDGTLGLLEIAPRVSGGMGLYRNLDVNFPLLSIYDRIDLDLDIHCQHYGIRMDRALASRFLLDIDYDTVYIDLDDTLLMNGKTNPMAVAFVHQCRNQGKKIHLLSRHEGDIDETLARHGLSGLFDSVVPFDRLSCKSERINAAKAIFVDDSYAERRKVHTALEIPTFSVDALESLLDWRA